MNRNNPGSLHRSWLCGLLLALLAWPALADESPVARISVSGQGESSLAPDMAVVSLSVTREAETAREALDSSSTAMRQVIQAMGDIGIAERDLQTTNFSIQPRYVYPESRKNQPDQAPRIVGYRVSNSLSVRVRDIAKVGEVLDTAIELGVNDGGQLLLTNDDPGAALEQARVAAVKDALAKAATLAEAAGVKTGDIISLSEHTMSPRPKAMMASAEMGMMRAADSVPVATGENIYQVTVQLTVAIDQ